MPAVLSVTMRISEEIDALEVMGINPVRFLVWPKFVAMVVMAPLLTLWCDGVGMTAGGIFSSLALGLSGKVYFEQTVNFLTMRDLLSGLVKSAGFGAAITLISCWQGFLAREGAADVGRRTTKAVVQSIFFMVRGSRCLPRPSWSRASGCPAARPFPARTSTI